MRLYDHELRNFPVVAADGIEIGRTHALIINTETLKVDALEVKLDRDTEEDVGARHHALRASTLEVPARFIITIGDAVMLGVREDQLREYVEDQRQKEERAAEIPGYGEGL